MESEIKGVSVRAWLALITVTSGLGFLYAMAFTAIWLVGTETALQVGLTVVTAVIGFVNLALGYYLGQKVTSGNQTETDS